MTSEPRSLSIAALVASLAAFAVAWFPYAAIPLGGAAVVLGGVAIAKRHRKDIAVIGILLGISAITTALVIAIALAIPPAQS